MKFLAIALAAFWVAAVDAAAAGGPPVRRHLNKHKIMEKAVRVNRKGERLLDQNFELSGAYSLQFDQCVSLTTEPYSDEVVFAESLIQYTSNGQITSQKSFILFNVCETSYCDYYEADDNLFMVDIDTYMASISEFYADVQENYCEACQNSQNYCSYVAYQENTGTPSNRVSSYSNWFQNYFNNNNDAADEYQQADEEQADEYQQADEEQQADEYQEANEYQQADGYQQANEEQQDGGRMLNQARYQRVECEMCQKFKCFENNAEDENQDDTYEMSTESITGWIENIAACPATDGLLDDYWPLYSGFMCNEDGSGVEIALFLDEDCSIYTSKQSFQNVASEYDQAYMNEAADIITYPFLNAISCSAESNFLSYQDYYEMGQNYQYDNANQDQDYGDASEFCQAVFEGGDAGGAVSLRDCDQDGQEDQQAEENNVYEYSSSDYYWYTFFLSYEDSQDLEATCSLMAQLEGEYTPVYQWKSSGQLYDYGTGPNYSTSNIRDFFKDYGKMDATLIAAIVLGVAFALLSSLCILYSCCCAKSVPNQYGAQKAALIENKRELVDERTGNMLM